MRDGSIPKAKRFVRTVNVNGTYVRLLMYTSSIFGLEVEKHMQFFVQKLAFALVLTDRTPSESLLL